MYWVKERTGTRKGTHVFSCAHYFQAPGNQMRPCVESIRSQYPRGSNFHLHKSRLFYLSNLLLVWFWPKYWSSIPPPPCICIPPTGERSQNLPDLTLYMYHVLQNTKSDQNEISNYNGRRSV